MDKIKDLLEVIVKSVIDLNKSIGFKGVIRYILVVLAVIVALNFRLVVEETIKMFDQISTAIHDGKMQKRDELMFELSPLLTELRAVTGADRILYIEFHNSKENLVGIPFKYLDLVLTTKKYGVPEFDVKKYHELSSGILSPIYPVLRRSGYVVNHGSSDMQFIREYHEVSDFVNAQDGSIQQVYLNLPGINTPIGIIILEWLSEDQEKDWDSIINLSRDYVTRINGLVLSKLSY